MYGTNSVSLIGIVNKMNQGTDDSGIDRRADGVQHIGCAVNPRPPRTSTTSSSTSRKKIDAGAQFVMTQPVYELSCWENFLKRLGGMPIPS